MGQPVNTKGKQLFVLDTNVLIHDPTSVFRFEEHDVVIPLVVLEELDDNKKGHSEVARNARTACKIIDSILSKDLSNVKAGISLKDASGGIATGRIFVQGVNGSTDKKPDNQILDATEKLAREHEDRQVILVCKDTNMRVKGRARGITVEDYHNDQVIEDADLLYSGSRILQPDFWETQGNNLRTWRDHNTDHYEVSGSVANELRLNEFVHFKGDRDFHARTVQKEDDVAVLRVIHDYHHKKNEVWGITARNYEQNYALNLLLDPDIDLVTLAGPAGTGKTLLTLAAGLSQVMEKDSRYNEIIMTRVTVPMGEDIGFLPGTEEEKMSPWMGALDDNLDVLHEKEGKDEWGRAATRELLRSRIKVKSLNFMRGRTFLNKFLIIDEVQNLTSKQVKALVTRAGPGTKVVCLGNLAQIDTPYLTEGSSGLAYLVDRFKGWAHGGHVTLHAGERSRLSSHANEVL